MSGVRCIVSGKVQGVFFRQSTLRMAQVLGVNGRVRNLSSGDVEVVACGDSADVEKLVQWLWQGPVTSEVSNVQVSVIEGVDYADFAVDY